VFSDALCARKSYNQYASPFVLQCVLFIDEMDSLVPARGRSGSGGGGGVMDRIMSQLLTEFDGVGDNTDVFVIRATNRPDLLDAAVMRPGRLDRCVYLGLPHTHAAQVPIFRALTRKFNLDADVDLAAVAEHCALAFTGADFYALASDAMLAALQRKIGDVDERVAAVNTRTVATTAAAAAAAAEVGGGVVDDEDGEATPQLVMATMAASDLQIIVRQSDLVEAAHRLTPSLNAEEIERYRRVREQFNSSRAQQKK
jgi:peroxin-6